MFPEVQQVEEELLSDLEESMTMVLSFSKILFLRVQGICPAWRH
jgi:hypothetical protein